MRRIIEVLGGLFTPSRRLSCSSSASVRRLGELVFVGGHQIATTSFSRNPQTPVKLVVAVNWILAFQSFLQLRSRSDTSASALFC